jgi:hypothetical protein
MYDKEAEQAVDEIRKDGVTPLSKAEQYSRLKRFAVRQKLSPSETDEAAFVRYITKDSSGKELYRTFTQTKGASFDASKLPSGAQPGGHPTPKPQSGRDRDGDEDAGAESPGLATLREISNQIRAKHPELSPQQATAKALQTVEGARAALQERQERLGKAARFAGLLG